MLSELGSKVVKHLPGFFAPASSVILPPCSLTRCIDCYCTTVLARGATR